MSKQQSFNCPVVCSTSCVVFLIQVDAFATEISARLGISKVNTEIFQTNEAAVKSFEESYVQDNTKKICGISFDVKNDVYKYYIRLDYGVVFPGKVLFATFNRKQLSLWLFDFLFAY